MKQVVERVEETGSTLDGAMKRAFEVQGYVVVPGLLSRSEMRTYRRKLQQISELSDRDAQNDDVREKGWKDPDGVTQRPEFWPLLFHPTLISALRNVLGPEVRYTQHSDLHVHHGAVGWHRDCANRTFGVGPDWDERECRYQVVRVAIYLQTYAESGFALGLIPGSHRSEKAGTRLELRAWDLLSRFPALRKRIPPLWLTAKQWVRTEPGDCIIFDQRVLHTGSHIRGPKYAIFLSYGVENEHSRRHRRFYLFERPDLHYRDYSPELAERLQQSNLYLDWRT
jgi:hypothetical protein